MRFLDAAAEEMATAAEWYESKGAGLGERFLHSVREAVALLDEFPHLGVVWRSAEFPQQASPRRFPLRTFPFVIIYVTEPDPVVVAVAHGHREPGYWSDRLQDDPEHQSREGGP